MMKAGRKNLFMERRNLYNSVDKTLVSILKSEDSIFYPFNSWAKISRHNNIKSGRQHILFFSIALILQSISNIIIIYYLLFIIYYYYLLKTNHLH